MTAQRSTTKPRATTPKAAAALSPEARAVWARLAAEYELGDAGAVEVLTAGLYAFDTMRQAEGMLRADGLCTLDRYGTPKAHPAADIAHRARGQWLGALRMLGLHSEADDEPA